MKKIIIKNARVHNLKNVDVEIPRNQINVLVGVSGSGKSTIAHNIIANEAQREYLESMNSYARGSFPKIGKADIDSIEGISPCIIVDQKTLGKNPRSTVGTVTDIYAYIRLLFSRAGSLKLNASDFSYNTPKGACEKCQGLGREFAPKVNMFFDFEKTLNEERCIKHRKFKHQSRYWNIIRATNLFDFDKKIKNFSKEEMDKLLFSLPITYQSKNAGFIQNFKFEGIVTRLRRNKGDSRGLDSRYDEDFFEIKVCSECSGSRLNEKARSVLIDGISVVDILNMEFSELYTFIKNIENEAVTELKATILKRVDNLLKVDLGYLTLGRGVASLSGGESHRLKLARELGSNLIEMIYILDEPTAGLHPQDRQNLIEIFSKLKKAENTVIIVEHDDLVVKKADHIIEIGPGAGRRGGEVVFAGDFAELKKASTKTGKYFQQKIEIKQAVRKFDKYLLVKNARKHNLKNLQVKIPLNLFCAITGVSGSGKSSLIIDEFSKQFNEENIILVDQSSLRGSVKGNIATYTGVFNEIRNIFAKENNVSSSLFSSNSKGACQKCKGLGFIKMDMHFMGDVEIVCEECQGKKYQKEALQYTYQNKNIANVLAMTVNEASDFFKQKSIQQKLKILREVGLGYLTLGQTHNTFSGGEAQRLRLASQLHKKGSIFILDEPTSGLHFADIEKMLKLLNKLINKGNSVIVIEHSVDVIKQADWIIDMGPAGGKNGGEIIAQGTPLEIKQNDKSSIRKFL